MWRRIYLLFSLRLLFYGFSETQRSFQDGEACFGQGRCSKLSIIQYLFRYVSDGTVAMFISLLLFLLPAENPFEYTGKGNIPTIMTWKAMQEKFAWSTFLLLGGGYGIAAGVEQSGLSKLISKHLSEFNDLPDWAFLLVAGMMVTMLTEFSSNVTTASIFIPMMDSLAQARQSNPLLFILPTTLSCSYSFMFPAATPPNAIVFGLKVMSLLDMAKAGAILNFIGFILLQGMTMTYGKWLFDLDKMPDWAIIKNGSHLHQEL